MVPSIRIIRPSIGNAAAFADTVNGGLNEAPTHGSGVAGPLISGDPYHDEMEDDFGLDGGLDVLKPRRMSPREERMKWWKVYAMHFLFSWNSRTFEYVSIFLVALAFPKGLLASSIKGMTSTVSALLCSSAVGNWIDRSPSRLPTLLISIFINHTAIVASYCCWLYWPVIAGDGSEVAGAVSTPFPNVSTGFLYGLILLFDVIHDLSAIANRLSLERDWVPLLVGPITSETTYGLTQVNSVMMRLELLVKLIAPSLLPIIMSTFGSRAAWISLLLAVTVGMWAVEVWCAKLVAKENPVLQEPKKPSQDPATLEDLEIEDRFVHLKPDFSSYPRKMYSVLYQDPITRLRHFFSISMWPASISLALLQVTVLAYSATLITYLLQNGFSISIITVARASGAITGLASTIITPWFVGVLRNRYISLLHPEEDGKDDAAEGKVVRTVGLWGILFQFLCLIPVVLVLWTLSSVAPEMESRQTEGSNVPSPQILISVIFFAFLSMSRIGHYMNSLMVQELGQVEIPVSQRSTYAGTEQSFRSLGELGHWAATVVWSRPEQFKWLALGSLMLIGSSLVMFGTWSRKPPRRSGHRTYENVPLNDLEDD